MTFVLKIPDEMRQKYIERRVQDLAALRSAAARNEFDVFSKVGHQLKGNAATFGYDFLGILGEKMEEISETHDQNDAEICLTKLSAWIAEQKTVVK